LIGLRELVDFEDFSLTWGGEYRKLTGMTVVQIPDLVFPDEELQKLGHIIFESLDDILEYEFPCK